MESIESIYNLEPCRFSPDLLLDDKENDENECIEISKMSNSKLKKIEAKDFSYISNRDIPNQNKRPLETKRRLSKIFRKSNSRKSESERLETNGIRKKKQWKELVLLLLLKRRKSKTIHDEKKAKLRHEIESRIDEEGDYAENHTRDLSKLSVAALASLDDNVAEYLYESCVLQNQRASELLKEERMSVNRLQKIEVERKSKLLKMQQEEHQRWISSDLKESLVESNEMVQLDDYELISLGQINKMLEKDSIFLNENWHMNMEKENYSGTRNDMNNGIIKNNENSCSKTLGTKRYSRKHRRSYRRMNSLDEECLKQVFQEEMK